MAFHEERQRIEDPPTLTNSKNALNRLVAEFKLHFYILLKAPPGTTTT